MGVASCRKDDRQWLSPWESLLVSWEYTAPSQYEFTLLSDLVFGLMRVSEDSFQRAGSVQQHSSQPSAISLVTPTRNDSLDHRPGGNFSLSATRPVHQPYKRNDAVKGLVAAMGSAFSRASHNMISNSG